MKLNLKSPLCFLDLEATGTNVTRDRIVEIAVIKLSPNGEKVCKRDLINPGIPIPPETSAIHHIFDQDVAEKPTFKEVAKDYERFFQGADFAGFNIIRFDIPLLVEEFLRVGIQFDYTRKKMIDSKEIYHMMERRDLRSAYAFYCKKELENAHSAQADAEASMEVLMAQIAKYENQPLMDTTGKQRGTITNDMEALHQLTTHEMVDLAGRIVRDKTGIPVINFGKYKGQPVMKVLSQDPAYYSWVMNGDFPQDTKRKLTEIKLSGFKK